VPFVGSFVALIWLLVLAIIGLAAAHRTDTWRTALAVLVPMVLGISAIALTTFLGGVTQTLIP
jgi:predicted exporter